MASASAARRIAGAAADQPPLPDEILEEILGRLDDAADLARAACACASFRRVVSPLRFVRRFRSLHPPPVVGFFSVDGGVAFHPADPPHRSAAAARAVAQAADFAFTFLPIPNPNPEPRRRYEWIVCDARDGRVLLTWRPKGILHIPYVEALVVCDPLHRRYRQIPQIPEDLLASAGHSGMLHFEPFLVPLPAGEEEVEASLQVMCNVASHSEDSFVTLFVFSSASGTWRGVTSFSLVTPQQIGYTPRLSRRCYAHSCFFWMANYGRMLVLDINEMKFSVADLQLQSWMYVQRPQVTIAEADEGRLNLLVLGDYTLDIYSCSTWRDNSDGAEKWRHDNVVTLPEPGCNKWLISGVSENYLLLQAIPLGYLQLTSPLEHKIRSQYFTVDMKTFLVEKIWQQTMNLYIGRAHLFTSFPPLLLPVPSI